MKKQNNVEDKTLRELNSNHIHGCRCFTCMGIKLGQDMMWSRGPHLIKTDFEGALFRRMCEDK